MSRKLRILINGFGRIGRIITRINLEKDIFDLVAINDINGDVNNLLYLLKYDSTYGRLKARIETVDGMLFINNKKVKYYNNQCSKEIPLDSDNIDIIIDSSGQNIDTDTINYYSNKIKHYIVTNEPGNAKTIIMGVNEDKLVVNKDLYISSSICDSVAFVPIINQLLSEYGIVSGFLTTLHPWLGYQKLLDSSKIEELNDVDGYALGRAALSSVIPKSTSAIKASTKVLPEIRGKIESFSYRIPTATVSSAVLNVTLNNSIDVDKLNNLFINFTKKQKYQIMYLNHENLVSIDYSGFNYSSIIDMKWNKVLNNNNVQIVYWYDNEWGYCCRVVDLVDYITSKY